MKNNPYKFSSGDPVVDGYGLSAVVLRGDQSGSYIRYDGDGGESVYLANSDLTPAEPQRSNPVQSPSHYDLPGGIQVIDLIRGESFLRGNLIKYVFRAPHKGNELQDMKKAAEYLKWEIERLENE